VTTKAADSLERDVESLAATPVGQELPPNAEQVVNALLDALEHGDVRAARRDGSGTWHAVPWVKRGILVGFRAGRLV